MKEEIEDNQAILCALDDMDVFRLFKELCKQEVAGSIESVYREVGKDIDDQTVVAACQNALAIAAMT